MGSVGGGRIIPSLNLFFHLQTFVITQNMKCNTDQYHRLQPLSTKKATFSFIYPLEASSDWLRQLPVLHRVAGLADESIPYHHCLDRYHSANKW